MVGLVRRSRLFLRATALALFGLTGSTAASSDSTWVLEEVQRFPSSIVKFTVGSEGNLYGSAIAVPPWAASGSIFRIDAAGTFATLHAFTDDSASKLVVGQDGALYGTTCEGCIDNNNKSDVFRIDHQGNYSTLVTLPIWADSNLILGGGGDLYGVLGFEPLQGFVWVGGSAPG